MWYLLLLPLVFLLPYLGCYLLAPGSAYSDLLITHLPNAIFLRQAVSQYHQIPLWSSTILSGYPFAADPLSGLWYPPGWLAILLPDPWGFNITLLLHLFWGGLGLYLFLKREGVSPAGAALGGILFAALPKTVSHLAAGHVTLVYAVSWTPWLLWCEAALISPNSRKLFRFFPALIFSALILADVRWAIPAGLLWMAYAIKTRRVQSGAKISQVFSCLSAIGFHMGKQVSLALLLAAPLLIPLFQYTSLSTRSAMDSSDATNLSLPIGHLLGLFYPNLGGNPEWMLYLGGVTAILILLSVLDSGQQRRYAFWWLVFCISLVLALGENLPVVKSLYGLPGMRLLRVPPRFLFLTGLSAGVISALAFDRLRESIQGITAWQKPRTSLALAGFGFLLLLFSVGLWAYSPSKEWTTVWAGVVAFASAIVVILRIKSVFDWKPAAILLVLLLVLDVSIINRTDVRPVAQIPVPENQRAVISKIAKDPGMFRVYSPSYSIPQNVAVKAGIQLADGVDPLQLAAYRGFMDRASGVASEGYSVTLPSFATANPETDNAAALPDPRSLGWLNVKYVVSAFELQVDGLHLIDRYGNIYLYRNERVQPRTWVQTSDLPDPVRDRAVTRLDWSPNEIQIEASGPGTLVLSEINYPGWTVSVDGRSESIETIDDVLRGVSLSPGAHRIVFAFQPVSVFLGIGGAPIGLAIVVWGWLAARRMRKHE